MITLNDLLEKQGIDPRLVIVLRHRPTEPALRKVLPWLAHEHPLVFNAYQQHHGERVERAFKKLVGKGHVASFIGMNPGEAVFAGVYEIHGSDQITYDQFWSIPEIQELSTHRIVGWQKGQREYHEWFDLRRLANHQEWIGKLIVKWPPPELSWWRRADKNVFPVLAIAEESHFTAHMPEWQDLVLSWVELNTIPTRWRMKLEEWRAIYHIRDISDGKSYVGSASGRKNLLGRWLNYADSGHGDNVKLRQRTPENFQFSILQRVSPDMEQSEIVILESSWKDRLQTRGEYGLNVN